MINSLSVKSLLLTSLLVLSAQNAFASEPMGVCPTPDMLKTFDGDFIETLPMAVDAQTGTVTMSMIQRRKFSDDASHFAGYGNLVFVMSGIATQNGGNAEKNAQTLLAKMQLDSEMPFQFQVSDSITVPMCSYSIPGESVTALVYQIPALKPTKAIV